jgi:Zn-dependent protease
MNEIISTLCIFALPVLLAFTWHEAAHAFAANYFGDKTPYSLGRVTLNPEKHIDWLGTIFLPIVTFSLAASTGFPFIFGYAKPVPLNFGQMRNPKRAMAWVSFAGPAANLLMALLWLTMQVILQAMHNDVKFFTGMAQAGVFVNLLIFALNMLPLPPLDGGRVLIGLLPHDYALKVARIEPYGFFIIIILAMTNNLLFRFWIYPLVGIATLILNIIVSPLTYLLN